ncbi:MAG: hypothetical protein KAH56_10725, partial [Candidatus Krumholzibacteria bacterium]|nr:hypothetical protein [Candidatus Krumholzibacteria bacterium]
VESKPPSDGLQFAPLVILTYLLGPFSVHFNPENRHRKELLTAGMISGTAGLGMFAGRNFILDITGKGWPLWPVALIGALVLVTAFSVWARAAFLAGSGERQPRHKLPPILRKPWAVGIVGLMAPGLGLLLAGCARRGAAVIWAAWPVAGAVLVLTNGLQIWSRSMGAKAGSLQPAVIEGVFMISAGILAVGLIGWIAQALEGARQMMDDPGIGNRMRGDWYAAALMCTLAGMAFVWDPPNMARHLDNGGIILREKGLRIIPLHLTTAAHRLDPGPSEYPVRVLELYEELGRRDEAIRLRRELDGNLASYLALVHTENRHLATTPYTGRSPVQERKLIADLFGQADLYEGVRPAYQAR